MMRHAGRVQGELHLILYTRKRGKWPGAALPHCPLSRLFRRPRASGLERLPTLHAEPTATDCRVTGPAPAAQGLAAAAAERRVRHDDGRAAGAARMAVLRLRANRSRCHLSRDSGGAAGALWLTTTGPRRHVAGQPETHDDPGAATGYPGKSGKSGDTGREDVPSAFRSLSSR